MSRFLEALRLVRQLNTEAASEDSNAGRGALMATRLDNVVLSIADGRDLLL